MIRLVSTIRGDARLQARNGFYYASAFVAAVSILVLSQLRLSQETLALILPAIILQNLFINTFYFIAGLILLEKGEGTLESLIVSPLRKEEYLASKLVTLTLLSIFESLIIVIAVFGFDFNLPLLIVSFVLQGVFYALLGFILIVRYESINTFLLPAVLITVVLSIPLLDYFGIWQSRLVYLHPFQASLVLLKAAFQPVQNWQIVYGIIYLLLWIGLAYGWSRRVFYRFVIAKEGNLSRGLIPWPGQRERRETQRPALNILWTTMLGAGKRVIARRVSLRPGSITWTPLYRVAYVLKSLGPIDARNVRRDSLLLWMALMPFAFVLIFRFLVPWARDGLLAQFGFDLAPFYILIMSYAFIIGTPLLFGVVIGFLLLDERDDQTLTALQVTPLGLTSYLAYRIALPVLISLLLTIVTFPLARLVTFPIGHLFLVALLAAPLAPTFALFMAAFAQNKVQGLAIMKASGTFLVLPLLGYFVRSNWQWAFGLIPTYWPAKVYWILDAGEPGAWICFLAGVVFQVALLLILLGRFKRVIHQ